MPNPRSHHDWVLIYPKANSASCEWGEPICFISHFPTGWPVLFPSVEINEKIQNDIIKACQVFGDSEAQATWRQCFNKIPNSAKYKLQSARVSDFFLQFSDPPVIDHAVGHSSIVQVSQLKVGPQLTTFKYQIQPGNKVFIIFLFFYKKNPFFFSGGHQIENSYLIGKVSEVNDHTVVVCLYKPSGIVYPITCNPDQLLFP